MHSDPVANFLTCVRNGYRARAQRVQIPYSRLNEKLALVLKQEGYLGEVRVLGSTPAERKLEVVLRYDEKRQAVIADIQRVSRPGLRRHFRCDKIPSVRNGLGVVVLTTSRGLMTDREARRGRIGGEALCAVW